MARYHGKAGEVWVSATTAVPTGAIGQLSEWSLELGREMVDVTCFGDANKTYVSGLPDLKGKFSGFWDDTADTLFQAADSAAGCYIYIYPSSDAPVKYWYGLANLEVSLSGSVSKAVEVEGTFTARGSWTRNTS